MFFFSCKSHSTITNVHPSVSQKAKHSKSLKSSSFIFHSSSFLILHSSFLPSFFIHPSFILHSFHHFATFKLFSLFNCTGRNCIITSLVWPRNFYTGIKISDSACLDLYFAKPNMIKKKINYSLILDLLQITFYFTLMKHCGNMLLFHIV